MAHEDEPLWKWKRKPITAKERVPNRKLLEKIYKEILLINVKGQTLQF